MPGRFEEAICRFCNSKIVFYSRILTKRGTLQALEPETYRDHYFMNQAHYRWIQEHA